MKLAFGVVCAFAGFLLLGMFLVAAGDADLATTSEPAAVETTAPGVVDGILGIVSPTPGSAVSSPLSVEGITSATAVAYRLIGGDDQILAEGVIPTDGTAEAQFSASIEFASDCCKEMTLELETNEGLGSQTPLVLSDK